MAIDTSSGSPAMDYAEHVRTYNEFIRLTKVAIGVIIVLLAGMAYFLV